MKRIRTILTAGFVLIALTAGGIFLGLFWTGHTYLRFNGKPDDTQVRVACVGNSVTYGYGIFGAPLKNYPRKLSERLGDGYHVANFGLSSHCVQDSGDMPYRGTTVFRDSVAYEADILILMMGSNDCKMENWQGIDTFRQAYQALLASYGDVGEIYLCPPAFPHPAENGTVSFGIRPDAMEEICTMIRTLAAERGYHLLDIQALTAPHPAWFLSDGVHPNAAGAAAMAEYIAGAIQNS